MKKTVIGVLFMMGLTVNAAVTLVKDGQPMAEIIMATNAPQIVKLAAQDLQEHVALMSGARLAIVSAPTGKTPIYVGDSPDTRRLGIGVSDIRGSGFKIIVRDKYVVLIGRDIQRKKFPYSRYIKESLKKYQDLVGASFLPGDITYPGLGVYSDLRPVPANMTEYGMLTTDDAGTWYAVAELLEQLGVRWYMPYENGTVMPSLKSIELPEQNVMKEAAFPVRDYFYYGIRGDVDINKWQKRQKVGSAEIYSVNHTLNDILDSPAVQREHPEYYAKRNGKPGGCMGQFVPKLSIPALQQAAILYLRKEFEIYPGVRALSVGMPDCLCWIDEEDLKAWPYGNTYWNRYTDYVADFNVTIARELKKSNPDRFLLYAAYAGYSDPPAYAMPDNVMVMMCYPTRNKADPRENTRLKQTRDAWLKVLPSKKMFTWDYFLFNYEKQNRVPAFFFDLLQRDTQSWKGISVGKFFEVPDEKINGKSRLAAPGLIHMLIYWQNKLLWDPDLDRLKLFDEYYKLYYGPAKAEMKEFFEFAEAVYMRPESRSITRTGGYLREADVPRYFEILARARAKAGSGTVYDKRIAMIEEEIHPIKKMFEGFKRTTPEVRMYPCDNPTQIDGDLTKPFWTPTDWRTLLEFTTCAAPATNKTSATVRLAQNGSQLLIGVICDERFMDKLESVTRCTKNDDGAIFNDDCVEVFIETPERSYFKITVNAHSDRQDVSGPGQAGGESTAVQNNRVLGQAGYFHW